MKIYVVVGSHLEDYGEVCSIRENLGAYATQEVAENIAKQYLQAHDYYSAVIDVFELGGEKLESYEIYSNGKVIEE